MTGSALSRYEQFVNPQLARLLHGLGMDVTFTYGAGTRLFGADGQSYLDFAGAYGALPFGHNPWEIWDAIDQLRRHGEPSLVQPSPLAAAGELAERLIAIAPAGLRFAFFANSGAEAVEAALKLARASTGRHVIVSTVDSFHGKTLGALSATGRLRYQAPFGAPAGGFISVPYGDIAALTGVFAAHAGDIAAFIVEPIQGEGGVHPAPPGYLSAARELCTRYRARLIFDEVQTGLGRTGAMFACQHDGITPDIMPLAKALGGGLVPAAAVLYNKASASEDFALRHTSTFGGNAFSARVALASLDLLVRQDLAAAAAERGEQLLAGLRALAEKHPALIQAVRGRGLLLGLQLSSDPAHYPWQGLFRSLAEQEGLAAFLCGYMLRREHIRLAPAYFAASVLRIEPPLTVSDTECESFLAALGRALEVIDSGRSDKFFAHLCGAAKPPRRNARNTLRPHIVTPRPHEPRWAFLAHPTDDPSYASYDTMLGWPGAKVRELFERMSACRTPDTEAAMFVGSCRVEAAGTSSYGEVFALPYNARQLLDLPSAQATTLVQQALARAVRRGAQVAGLGAYTSIITRNAEALADAGIPVTTGNAYTVVSGVDALLGACADPGLAECAVIGAAGSIGRAAALLLSESVGALVLCGNPRSGGAGLQRLSEVAQDVVAHLRQGHGTGALAQTVQSIDGPLDRVITKLAENGLLSCTLNVAEAVTGASLLLAATSTPGSIIDSAGLRRHAVICDISQPPNVSPRVRQRRKDVTVLSGGLVRLPHDQDLAVTFGLPTGLMYACMAETVVLAHQLAEHPVSSGSRLDPAHVKAIGAGARRMGFLTTPPLPFKETAG